MRSIWLVAKREFRQITTTRGFWVMLLSIPLIIVATQVVTTLARSSPSVAYVIVDQSGAYAHAVEARIDRFNQRRLLTALSDYASNWKNEGPPSSEPWAASRQWFSDSEIDAFAAQGGLNAALERLRPHLRGDAPAFRAPPPTYLRTTLPASTSVADPVAFGAAVTPLLKHRIATPLGQMPFAAAIYVPADFGAPASSVQIWTNGDPIPNMIELVRSELTSALRARALQSAAISADAYARIDSITANLTVTTPSAGSGVQRLVIQSVVPIALVYLLLMTVIVSGQLLLQSVIEERSNKLIESVLACITPTQLMFGKLAGLAAMSLTVVFVWVGFGVAAASTFRDVLPNLQPALANLTEPWMVVALLFYFLSGYLVISMIYLAIGAMSDSIQDAQSYLMPVVLFVTLPIGFMLSTMIQDPDGTAPRVMSWIPIYTPFAMLGRLGSGVSLSELLGTGALLVAFIALEIRVLGRLFETNVLNTGQAKKLRGWTTALRRRA